jgi:salicylate hydroxylase
MPNGPEQEKRDALFLEQLGKELQAPYPSRWSCPETQKWLYGYNAFQEVEEAIKIDPVSSPRISASL